MMSAQHDQEHDGETVCSPEGSVCPEESCDLPDAEDARLGFLYDFLCTTQAIVCYIFRANSNA